MNQPNTFAGEARHRALASIESAASLLSQGRWFVAGFLLLCCLPCSRLAIFFPIVGLVAFAIAYGLSSPIEEMAADVRNRVARPLIIAMSVFGFLLVVQLVLLGLVARDFVYTQNEIDILVGCLLAAVIVGTGWLLWRFVVAWKAINWLRRESASGFAVIVAGAAPAQPPPAMVIPPRPKR